MYFLNQGVFLRTIAWADTHDTDVKMIPYENRILGINSQHPENWTEHEGNDSVRFIAPQLNASDNHTEQLKIASFTPGSISFFPSKKTSLFNLVDKATSYLNQTKKDFVLLNSQPATVNGKRAHLLEYTYTSTLGPTKSLGLIIPNGVNLYFISYFADPERYPTLLPIVSRIINSTEVGIFDSGIRGINTRNSDVGSSGSNGISDVGSSGSSDDRLICNSGSSGSSGSSDNRGNCNNVESVNSGSANEGSGSGANKHHDATTSNDLSRDDSSSGDAGGGDCKRDPNGGDCIEPEGNTGEAPQQ